MNDIGDDLPPDALSDTGEDPAPEAGRSAREWPV